ncbi:MAG: hypothetical protein AB7F66_17645 [Bacteriovoracia bacterium]
MENPNDQAPQGDDEIIDVSEIVARLDKLEKFAAEQALTNSNTSDRCGEIEAKVTELVEYCNSLGDDDSE